MSDTPRTDEQAFDVLDANDEHPREHNVHCGGEYVYAELARELEKQLAERDAALARCVEAAKLLLTEWKNKSPLAWQPERNPYLLEQLQEAVDYLPASAQATAKVLAAVQWLVATPRTQLYVKANGRIVLRLGRGRLSFYQNMPFVEGATLAEAVDAAKLLAFREEKEVK